MATPIELEQQRQEEAAAAEKQTLSANQKSVETNQIQKSTPEDQKPKGAAKLSSILFTLGSQIPQIIQPSLENLINKYIQDPNICPAGVNLLELIDQRNNITDQLNNIGVRINQTGTAITGISNFLGVIIPILTAVDIAAVGVSTASKFLPTVPGAVPAALNDIQTFIRKTTFDQYGNSKLAKLQGVISSSALSISIVGSYVLTAVNTLSLIDAFILSCDKFSNLIPTTPEINSIADSQRQANQTQNQTTYKGFIIEIEIVPFTPTVNRRRAIGKNSQGIKLVASDLSFTTNDLTLINELKLIIDNNNLFAEIPPPQSVISITSTTIELPPTTSPTTTTPTGDPTPLGYLGKYVGEKGYDVQDNGSVEDVYDWDGSKWIFIETRNI
jgi:hypothetical protein